MIEQIVRDYLEEQLGIPVRMEEEAGLPEEYIVVEKTGSGQTNHIKRATLAVQSYSSSLYQAASLNERVKEAMEKIIEMNVSSTVITTIQIRHGRSTGIRPYLISCIFKGRRLRCQIIRM